YARNVERLAARPALRLHAAAISRRPAGWMEQHLRRAPLHAGPLPVLHDPFLDRRCHAPFPYSTDPPAGPEEGAQGGPPHPAASLVLRPGQRVLEVGSSTGGLALSLAETGGVDVTGISSSATEVGGARRRAAEAGLAGGVSFHRRDLRHETGRYDRVVSVG